MRFFLTDYPSKRARYGFVLLVVALCTAIGLPMRDHLDAINITMVYVTGAVAVAAYGGFGAAFAASVLGVVAFNFFFTQPYYSLTVYDSGYLITFAMMITSSLITASLATHLKMQAASFHMQQDRTSRLYGLTSELAATRGYEAIAHVAANHIKHVFNCDMNILLPDDKGEFVAYPDVLAPYDIKDEAVALWCFENKRPAGFGTTTMHGSSSFCLPLLAGDVCLGVINLKPGNETFFQNNTLLDEDNLSLLHTFSSLLASALQRAHASIAAEAAKVNAETERVRNTLLSSVSHDLRTPLATVRGSIEAVLESSRHSLSTDAIELLETACVQSERLTRIVSDLLSMNRLETSGTLINRQPYYIDELIGSAVFHAKPWMGNRTLKTTIQANLPLIQIDGAFIEQLFMNILENAVKYTPENGIIRFHVARKSDVLFISISDNGSGIAMGEEQKVFEKFYRIKNNSVTRGSGLGLAICKAVVMAHGGEIWAENNETGGLTVALTLPIGNASRSFEKELGA